MELLGVLAQLPGPPGAGLSLSSRRVVPCLVSLAESNVPDADPTSRGCVYILNRHGGSNLQDEYSVYMASPS